MGIGNIICLELQKKIFLSTNKANNHVDVTLKTVVDKTTKEGLPIDGLDMCVDVGEVSGEHLEFSWILDGMPQSPTRMMFQQHIP